MKTKIFTVEIDGKIVDISVIVGPIIRADISPEVVARFIMRNEEAKKQLRRELLRVVK